jgi:hypothetical protein
MHFEILMAIEHNIVAYKIFCVKEQVFELLDLISLHSTIIVCSLSNMEACPYVSHVSYFPN